MSESTNKLIDNLVAGAKNVGKELSATGKQVTEDVKEMLNPRKFEFVKRIDELYPTFEYAPLMLPERSTALSAGYDFFNPYKQVCAPHAITLIKTGVKVCLDKNECLLLFNRSSNPKKKNLILANGVGVVDADYYNNSDNEGEIGFLFYNISDEPVSFNEGEKIGQGIFTKYGVVFGDEYGIGRKRDGGFGSTGK